MLTAFYGDDSFLNINIMASRLDLLVTAIDQAYDSLKNNFYTMLVEETRLYKYIKLVDIDVYSDSIFGYEEFDRYVEQQINENKNSSTVLEDLLLLISDDLVAFSDSNIYSQKNKLIDKIELVEIQDILTQYNVSVEDYGLIFNDYLGVDFISIKEGYTDKITINRNEAAILLSNDNNTNITVNAPHITIIGGRGDDNITTGKGDDAIYGGAGNDTINSGAGNDLVYGEEGDDYLVNSSGNTTLDGGAGNDILIGHYNASQTLIGGAGDDELKLNGSNSSSRAYQNHFRGGEGNDRISGGYSSDTYYYGLGDGHDVISDYGYGSNESSSYYRQDKLVFDANITPDMVHFTHDSNGNIIITITDPHNAANNGSITLTNAYTNIYHRIEAIEFACDPSGASNLNEAALLDAAKDIYLLSSGRTSKGIVNDIESDIEATIMNELSNEVVADKHVVDISTNSSALFNIQLDRLVSAMAGFDSDNGVAYILQQEEQEAFKPTLVSNWLLPKQLL